MDQLAEIQAASKQLGKQFGPKVMPLVNEIVEAAESWKQIIRMLAEFPQQEVVELMSRKTDLEGQVKDLSEEVAMYHGTKVYFKCDCCTRVFTTVRAMHLLHTRLTWTQLNVLPCRLMT